MAPRKTQPVKRAVATAAGTAIVKHKNKGGRPKGAGAYKPTPTERKLVERMAAMGVPMEDMVLILPSRSVGKKKVIEHISMTTLQKHYARELQHGRLKADVAVVNAFFENCLAGNVSAQIWYTKTRLGWRETLNVAPAAQQQGQQPAQGGQTYDMDQEPNRLEEARRVAFLMALGARIARPTA